MSLKGKLEAIIYAAEEPVTLEQMAALLKETVLADLATEAANAAAAEETAQAEPTPSEVVAEDARQSVEPVADTSTEQPADPATPETASKKKAKDPELAVVRARLRTVLAELVADYESDARGLEIRQVAGGYRMATKPEHHDVVVGFAKSLKPPIRLSLQALETLAVVAYKQPVTAPEVSEIRGVDSSGVIATLLDRKLVTTAGRKQVIGRPILYKTTKEFLLRFGLKDVNELPSMEEFEKLGDAGQGVLFEAEQAQKNQPEANRESEAARADDAMMAREDEMVARGDEEAAEAADANLASDSEATSTETASGRPEHESSKIENT